MVQNKAELYGRFRVGISSTLGFMLESGLADGGVRA
jgi:hypothetical protein